jgi:hypothetical protein
LRIATGTRIIYTEVDQVNGKSMLAAALAACYVGACVTSLWDRGDAIIYFALASSATLWFIFPVMAGRVAAGLAVGAIGVAIGVALPVVGDGIDIAGLLAIFVIGIVRNRRIYNFIVRLPLGVTCLGLYVILWSAARSLPPGYSMTVHHSVFFYIVVVLLAVLAGILPLLLIAWIYGLFGIPWATVVIYIVGYPFYLAMFILTWLSRGHDPSLADS